MPSGMASSWSYASGIGDRLAATLKRFHQGHPSITYRCSHNEQPSESSIVCKSRLIATRRSLLGFSTAAIVLTPSLASLAANEAAEIGKQPFWSLADLTDSLTRESMKLPNNVPETRIYDASVLGEPFLIKDKSRAWQRLSASRILYLGESEGVPEPSESVLQLDIVRKLRDTLVESNRQLMVAMSAIPSTMQAHIRDYLNGHLNEESLELQLSSWPAGRFQHYLPLLQYCRENKIQIQACGTPEHILADVQANGIGALSLADRRQYRSHSLLPGFSFPYMGSNSPLSPPSDPQAYQMAESRVVDDSNMARVVLQAVEAMAPSGMLIVITGESHVRYGVKGRGVPAQVWNRTLGRLLKKSQVVVLLNPELQVSRVEGQVPDADFLFYSGERVCRRNCFDRAEVARIMGAAGRGKESLPGDMREGVERGLVSPDTLIAFFEMESNPLVAQAARSFQGLRDRWLADPRFLQRLAIEEAISVSTTLLAQYQKRGSRFWSEIEYVVTDTTRGAVVDFFTVWLPAPTLSFRQLDAVEPAAGAWQGLTALLASLPDNAFQRAGLGEDWGLGSRVGSVLFGGLKLFVVGFVSCVGTLGVSNALVHFKQGMGGLTVATESPVKRPPVLKTAAVYGAFLATSANLRYQTIAGFVEHWVADYFLASQPLAGSILSFVARTVNSYWGTGQWVDIARRFQLQSHHEEGGDATVDSKSPTSDGTFSEL